MKLSEAEIEKIASELDLGMICHYHRVTGELVCFPDPDNEYVDAEMWKDEIKKVKNDAKNYHRFEPMNSTEAFRVMEHFAESLSDAPFASKLYKALANRRPFQGFKLLVDQSDYREQWFDFKRIAYLQFVKEQSPIQLSDSD
ncbi:MAG: hypothetical protein EP332_03550 [Bacteroidetes bacterium]|nr:MAG: hypothetical protein EP332_03550 [Bacteroidota bacterium]